MMMMILHVPGFVKKKENYQKEALKKKDTLILIRILQSILYQTHISCTETAPQHCICLGTGYKNHFDLTNPCINIFTGYRWTWTAGGHSHRMQGVYIHHPFFIASADSILKRHFHLIHDRKKISEYMIFVRWRNMPRMSMLFLSTSCALSLSSLPVLQRLPKPSCCNSRFFPTRTHAHKKSRLTNSRYIYIYKNFSISKLE